MRYTDMRCAIVRNADSSLDHARFVASTSAPDRYGDIVAQNWDLASYKRNPIILLNHNANALPIGKGSVDVVDGALQVDVAFDMDDPIGAEVARKTKAGFMSAVSVGFNPIASTPRSQLPKDHVAYGTKGTYFEKAELLEVSVVTIPANGDAVSIRNFVNQHRAVKVSSLKHILDVEMRDDVVIVTYARHDLEEMPEEEEGMHEDDEDSKEEMSGHKDEEMPEQEEGMHEDDEDEETKNLTQYEREFLRYLIGE